mgnify:FL=1|tara:strand:- start:765 stop:1121 length:357 start_codon:yes stop_codon:yes gene_type:complete
MTAGQVIVIFLLGETIMINVVAVITAKPGMRDILLKEFKENISAVHSEEGCIEYSAKIDASGFGEIQAKYGNDVFIVIEKWESKEHLMAHAISDHMKAYSKKTKDLIADRKIHILMPA